MDPVSGGTDIAVHPNKVVAAPQGEPSVAVPAVDV